MKYMKWNMIQNFALLSFSKWVVRNTTISRGLHWEFKFNGPHTYNQDKIMEFFHFLSNIFLMLKLCIYLKLIR